MGQENTKMQRNHSSAKVIRKLAEGGKPLDGGQDFTEICRHLAIEEADPAPLGDNMAP